MSTDANAVDELCSSFDATDVDWVRLAPEAVRPELTRRAREPAVASPLPFDGVSVPDGATIDPSEAELRAAETGITSARLAVAATGSVVIVPTERMEGPVSLYPPLHLAVVEAGDVVPDVASALSVLSAEFENGRNDAIFATGPSSTGDMGALVTGVHGPREVAVVVVEREEQADTERSDDDSAREER